jgi:hypothetical protein
MARSNSSCIQKCPVHQTTGSAARTTFRDLPDPERRRRLVEAIHRELGHTHSALPAMLTENEVARVLKRTIGTLRNRRWAGLPVPRYLTVGRSVMYEAEDVADFLLGEA